ncbi:MAG: DNA translocase FtsK, partial [Candidatus Omnitrophica bacterium]|nr:DNA translocase FtsK [Candidatus Omnitrophota bacterium]
IILLMFGALSLVVIGEFMVSPFFVWLFRSALNTVKGIFVKRPLPAASKPVPAKDLSFPKAPQTFGGDRTLTPKIRIVEPKEMPSPAAGHAIGGAGGTGGPKMAGEYHLPGLDLLNDPPQVAPSAIQSALMGGAKTLEETLADFGVNVKVVDIERGPVITRYELQPAPGVKIQRISSLSDDIALALSVPAVRILAPIPGKNRVGVEVPNGLSAAVYLKDVLAQSVARSSASKLMLAVGKDTSGQPLVADLCDMPHLLVAGTTGSGKTVCLNSLIMSILFNASPSQVKFIMVDPKMVELAPYNDLPHLICPVVTDVKKVTAALHWVVGEMEQRYKLLAKEQVRHIKGYQAKGHDMPYIVIVVDELADLMQVSARSIEGAIARLSQLARAVGIHLILATQRPSVDVVTGIIKANFPARISFKVASKVDSRTVLDGNGAQDLLGKGDLLFMKPGDGKPTRGQCCFVSDEEIARVIAFIKGQGDPEYNDNVLKPSASSGGAGMENDDEMYDEAVRVVVETNQASVSILQRRLRLGYSRAARLIDIMEQKGIVGAYAGSKARDILVDREKWLLDNMGNIPNDAGTNAAENT